MTFVEWVMYFPWTATVLLLPWSIALSLLVYKSGMAHLRHYTFDAVVMFVALALFAAIIFCWPS